MHALWGGQELKTLRNPYGLRRSRPTSKGRREGERKREGERRGRERLAPLRKFLDPPLERHSWYAA